MKSQTLFVLFFTILLFLPSNICYGNDMEKVLSKVNATVKKKEIYQYIEYNKIKAVNAIDNCVIAELMKRAGNYEATKYYERAIKANSADPFYDLCYADYLRNFRGPQRPLFPEAERHYYNALVKLDKLKKETRYESWHAEIQSMVERGLVALYQEDGLPLVPWPWQVKVNGGSEKIDKPLAFFSSTNQYVTNTTDIDRVDDVRDFTSEALFAESASRLNRNLTRSELRGIIRTKYQFQTLNRLRFRYENLPVLDLSYRFWRNDNAVVPNFFEPDKFTRVRLQEFGIAIEKPFNFGNLFDFYLRTGYRRIGRYGNIEFAPNSREDINQVDVKAVISRFFGPDKANLEVIYAYQDINPTIDLDIQRNRNIFGTKFTYQWFRFTPKVFGEHFTTRGIDTFAGFGLDKERFGSVDINKRDYYFGLAVKGIPLKSIFSPESKSALDITIQPTFFTGKVDGDSSQDNAFYRTNLTILYRMLDEERTSMMPPGCGPLYLAFVNLVLPFRHDVAIDGPNYFENFRVGLQLDVKFFTNSRYLTTFLASAGYDFQRFYNLNKNLSLFRVMFSMGF
jgi:hypothetical protein